ncbi:hypothetical protein BD769DRAFT_1385445 [Suillus cothurnatus]|nr:hypothetical protein BD769DRAFT_1385445 [Suillus cothurnatus]
MDTTPAFGFGLHDMATADPSLLANKCVEFLRCFMIPQSALLPISANSLKWLLEHKIVKSLIFCFVYHPSSTSGTQVVISDEEPVIFKTSKLPPMEMVAFVLAIIMPSLLGSSLLSMQKCWSTHRTCLFKQMTQQPGPPAGMQPAARKMSAGSPATCN